MSKEFSYLLFYLIKFLEKITLIFLTYALNTYISSYIHLYKNRRGDVFFFLSNLSTKTKNRRRVCHLIRTMGSLHVIFSQFIKVVIIYKILEMYVFSGKNLKL